MILPEKPGGTLLGDSVLPLLLISPATEPVARLQPGFIFIVLLNSLFPMRLPAPTARCPQLHASQRCRQRGTRSRGTGILLSPSRGADFSGPRSCVKAAAPPAGPACSGHRGDEAASKCRRWAPRCPGTCPGTSEAGGAGT